MENGIYLDVYAVVDGKRYPLKTISYSTLAQELVKTLMDGFEKAIAKKDEQQT